jgi:hypothetical protein
VRVSGLPKRDRTDGMENDSGRENRASFVFVQRLPRQSKRAEGTATRNCAPARPMLSRKSA